MTLNHIVVCTAISLLGSAAETNTALAAENRERYGIGSWVIERSVDKMTDKKSTQAVVYRTGGERNAPFAFSVACFGNQPAFFIHTQGYWGSSGKGIQYRVDTKKAVSAFWYGKSPGKFVFFYPTQTQLDEVLTGRVMLVRVEDLTQIYDVEFPLEDAKVAVPIALAGCGKPATQQNRRNLSLPKTRFEHIDGGARQGSDTQQLSIFSTVLIF
jgi:hypothetical protein